MDFSPKRAVDSLNERVRQSERFPRIRDVEKVLKEEEERKFVERVRLAPKGRRKLHRSFTEPYGDGSDYFSTHVLNSDPKCAKYMDYNEVAYPMMDGKWDVDIAPTEAMERLWVSGFLDQVNRDMNNTYKSDMAAHEAELMKGKPKKVKSKSDNSVKRKGLTDDDEMALHKWEESVLRNKPEGMKKVKGGIKAYKAANAAIIKSKQPMKPELPFFHSYELDSIFDRDRIENNAARVIQKNWRRQEAIFKLKYVVICMFSAVKIQRLVRGMIARKFVAKYHRAINELALQWQCRVRRWYSNRHIRPKLAEEVKMAIKIQSIIRAWSARRYYHIKLCHSAAVRIQTLWRGVLSRVVSDKVWLNKVVVPIQKFVRRVISRQKFLKEFKIHWDAALVIQKKFRCFVANKRLGSSLNKRESDYRTLLMEVLAAEEEHAEGTFTKLRAKLKKRGAKDKLTIAMQDLHTSFTDIHILESDYIEMIRQKDTLSPRAIQQGWVQEIDKSIIDLRRKITDAKLQCVLHKQWYVLSVQEVIDRKVDEAERYAYRKLEIADSREEEMECSQNRFMSFAMKERHDHKRALIAEERRKWKVRYYSKNGKPDRQRRPGRPWDPILYDKALEKQTYSGGADIDLLALNEGIVDSTKNGAGGSKDTVDKAIGQVALQNYLNEVAKYEQLLNPLNAIMEKQIKGSAGNGLGPFGKEFHTAAESAGIVPPATPPKIKRQLTAEFQSIIQENSWRGTTYADPDNALALIPGMPDSSPDGLQTRVYEDSISSLGELNPGDGDINLSAHKSRPLAPKNARNKTNIDLSPRTHMSRSVTSSNTSQYMDEANSLLVEDKLSLHATPTRQRWHRRNAPDEDSQPGTLRRSGVKKVHHRGKKGSSIPWHLLDQLDGEKRKFEAERDYILETKKF